MLPKSDSYDVIVIGGGVAGLTAAAILAHYGARTVVYERHNVPGGCASFYQRDGYRFDVGATLVGGFGLRGVHRSLNAELDIDVSARAIEPSMVIHLPDDTVVRYGDERWAPERRRAFGEAAEPFWQRQERIAELAWDLSTRFPALPVDAFGVRTLARAVRPRHLPLVATLGRTVDAILPRGADRRLRTFIDAQLLITAQCDARRADLAYGCTALDLAREGTFHLADGTSTIATALARAIRRAGSRIAYGTAVASIATRRGRACGVRLDDGTFVAARAVVAAIPAQNVVRLCPDVGPFYRARLAALPQRWGAAALFCGLPPGVVPSGTASHHQVVASYDEPLGEGITAFVSFSDEGETRRARRGGRAVTITTHTDVARWERAHRDGRTDALRAEYRRLLGSALERIVPGAFARAEIVEFADPHTYERYTGRLRGLVGGAAQTPAVATLGALSHRTPVRGLYACGDTTFPGQSTVGVSLSARTAAYAVLGRLGFRP